MESRLSCVRLLWVLSPPSKFMTSINAFCIKEWLRSMLARHREKLSYPCFAREVAYSGLLQIFCTCDRARRQERERESAPKPHFLLQSPSEWKKEMILISMEGNNMSFMIAFSLSLSWMDEHWSLWQEGREERKSSFSTNKGREKKSDWERETVLKMILFSSFFASLSSSERKC